MIRVSYDATADGGQWVEVTEWQCGRSIVGCYTSGARDARSLGIRSVPFIHHLAFVG